MYRHHPYQIRHTTGLDTAGIYSEKSIQNDFVEMFVFLSNKTLQMLSNYVLSMCDSCVIITDTLLSNINSSLF